MTINEMVNAIDAYCEYQDMHRTSCDGCKIGGLCESVGGDFRENEAECRKAYEIITARSEAKTHDEVNHPAHYVKGKYECIDVMVEALGAQEVKSFCLCNAFKYIYRCKTKNMMPITDIRKAAWYLNKYLELEDRKL